MSGALLPHDAARPLRAWSAADRARVAAAVEAALWEFRKDWGLGARVSAEAVQCAADFPPSASEAWSPVGPGLWLAEPSGAAVAALGRAFFGAPNAESTLAAEICAAAFRDFGLRLGSALGGALKTAGSEAPALQPWSGALRLAVPWCGQVLSVVASGERVARALSRDGGPEKATRADAPALTPLRRALEGHAARVRAQVREFQLDLGALASLRPGDVVRTGHPLESPLSITIQPQPGGTHVPFCAGFLGTSQGSRAVALSPFDASDTSNLNVRT